MFGRRKKREPGVWSDPAEALVRLPAPRTPEYERRLVAGDLALACYDPVAEKIEVLVAEGLGRYKDLRTPFYGHVRDLLRERGLKNELGRAKATEIEQRAKYYPYYEKKANFKALARLQLCQPIPVRGRPGEFWWPPKELARRPPVRGGTPEERQAIYDAEAEKTAKFLILAGEFRELMPFVGDGEGWLEGEGL